VPTNLTAAGAPNSASLTWDASVPSRSASITGYTVQYEVAGSNQWYELPTNSAAASFTLASLTATTTFTVRVIATDSNGLDSVASSPISFTTSTDPTYLVSTCQQLQDINNDLSANYVLTQDIDCSDTLNWNNGAGFIPIGNGDNPFIGTLNGNGHIISYLYIDDTTAYANGFADGLFDFIANAQISNLTLSDPIVSSNYVVASLVGIMQDSSIANLQVTGGTVILSSGQQGTVAGGLAAEAFGSAITQSSYSGTVTGDGIGVGGLVGIDQNDQENTGILSNDYTQASIVEANDSTDYVGGLAITLAGMVVTNSYASGSITVSGMGAGVIGGLASLSGAIGAPGEGIFNSFSDTTIDTSGMTNSPVVGGLNGSDQGDPSIIDTSDYFDASLAGTQNCTGDSSDSCSIVNISGTQPTYFDDNQTNPPLNAWDFSDIWGTTSLLPDFIPNAAVVPLVVHPNPLYVKSPPVTPVPPATPTKTQAVTQTVAMAITATSSHHQASTVTNGTTPTSGLGAIAGAIGHFIAHLPVGVVVAFPYLLFVLLILLGMAALVELGRELRRLREVQLLIDDQTKLAEERDNFWHLAANYLRAPITLLIGGSEALNDSLHSSLATELQRLATSLQSKVAGIMREIEHSQELINIKRPEAKLPAIRLLRSPRFWIPVLIVAGLAVGGDLIATNFRHISTSLVTYVSQILIFLLAATLFYWTLTLLQRGRQKRKSAETLLHQQERELKDARHSLITDTANSLDADVTSLERLLPQLPPEAAQLSLLNEGTHRLRRMITTFQLLTKVETLPRTPNPASLGTVGLAGLLSRGVSQSLELINSKHLNLVNDGPRDAILAGSPELLQYTVSSIIGNAAAFSPKNGTITLTTTQTASSATLVVDDQGQGIAEDQLEHLFKPFIKADGTDALELNHDGLGLSLYLDKIIMEEFGGSVAAESKLGHGTTITLTWPLAASTSTQAVAGQPTMVYPQDYRG
jgi:signal transduction histidine kinase